jgi:C-terminal processing protease CtpA/Prc
VAGVPGRTRGEEVELRAAAGADGALDVGTIRLLSVPDGEGSRDGRVGLWVRPVAGAAEVAYVRRGMAADAAGVSPGERVVSVDGREVAGLGTLAIDHLLAGPIGSHATIVLEGAEGRRRALSLERTPLQ